MPIPGEEPGVRADFSEFFLEDMDYRMNNRVRNLRQKSHPTAGFSLIEILVVLAVLVIGVLGIIRIFPYGFLAIQRTAEQTNASALANQQLEFEKNALSVPESIVAMDANGVINPNILPDNLNPEALDPNNQNALVADVNKINYVVGETFRIPTAFGSPNGMTNFGAVYTAQFGPIYFNPAATVTAPDPLNPQVTGTPLQRSEQPFKDQFGSETVPNLTSSAEYAIDYDRQLIAFYPRFVALPPNATVTTGRTFQFNYTYYTTTGGIKTVLSGSNKIYVPDIAIPVTAPQFLPTWQPIFSPAGAAAPALTLPADIDPNLGIRHGSEEVSRAFRLISPTPLAGTTTPPTWTSDPYEYALYSANEYGNGNVGVFVFNPVGHNETIVTATGTQPFSARISYQILDNHIVRDQRALPAVAPFDVRLSLPYVSTTGDVQLDQTNFAGLFGGNTANVLIYNANNGQLITRGSGECLPGSVPTGNAIGTANKFTVDAKTGVVHFDEAFITANNLQNVTLKIYYHTQKNFGAQLQKANAHYYPADTSTLLAYNNYFVGTGANAGRIYFPKCESGKTVTIGSLNYLDAAGNAQHASGENYQISNNASLYGTVGLPYIDLTTKHSNFGSLPDEKTTGLMAVDNVQGVSLKSRVLWLRSVSMSPNSQAGQPPVPTYHWRKLDQDTILTPNPTH